MNRGFSFASVVLSYFLVAGGLLSGLFVVSVVSQHPGAGLVYAFAALGAFLGGFIAARASPGSTIVEPMIGAVLLVGTIAGLILSTAGTTVWQIAPDEVKKFAAIYAACSVVGALAGAFLSEKLLGESTTAELPWIAYAAFSTYGACTIATLIATMLAVSGDDTLDTLAKMVLVGLAIGCLLAGLSIGSSARTRPLIAALLGGGAGVAAFVLLMTRNQHRDGDQNAGMIVLIVGGAIITLIGALIGWAVVGKRNAG